MSSSVMSCTSGRVDASVIKRGVEAVSAELGESRLCRAPTAGDELVADVVEPREVGRTRWTVTGPGSGSGSGHVAFVAPQLWP